MNNYEIHLQTQSVNSTWRALELCQLRPQLNLQSTAARLEAVAEWSDASEIGKSSPRGDVLRIAAEVLRALDAQVPVPDFWKFSPKTERIAKEILRFNRYSGTDTIQFNTL